MPEAIWWTEYRAALIDHNPSLLPLTSDARYTENAQDLKFGDGLWGTLTGWGSYKLYIDDPEKGEVGFVGETFEAGMPGLLCTRLAVVNRKISEIEALITRKETAAGFTRPDGLTDPKVAPGLAGFFEDVPEAERESRKDLITQTDLYFDGIEKSSGSIVPFAPDVIRVENGTQTCPSTFGSLSKNGQPVGCAAGLDSHIFEYIYPIRPRIYSVVDRQRGIVMGSFMFNTSGKVRVRERARSVGKVERIGGRSAPVQRRGGRNFQNQGWQDRLDYCRDDWLAVWRYFRLAITVPLCRTALRCNSEAGRHRREILRLRPAPANNWRECKPRGTPLRMTALLSRRYTIASFVRRILADWTDCVNTIFILPKTSKSCKTLIFTSENHPR